MIVRKAVINDLEPVAILFDAYRRFYKKEGDLPAARSFVSARMNNNDSEILVALDNTESIVAFVQLYPIFSSTRMKPLLLLNDLFIEPGSRGRGVSIALIDACKELCRRSNSCGMILETAKDNTTANSLYLKTGFHCDRDHNYYEWET